VAAQRYGQLTAGVVSEVVISPAAYSVVEVLVRVEYADDDASPIFVTVGTGDQSDPVVEGDDCEYAPAGTANMFPSPLNASQVSVKMVSAGSPKWGLRLW
jgi:hypothetical protein